MSTPLDQAIEFAAKGCVCTHAGLISLAEPLYTELTLANAENAKLREALERKINGLILFDYLIQQFPATVGHIPLQDWWKNAQQALSASTATGGKKDS